jgi:CRP-like cAMP-binding protein
MEKIVQHSTLVSFAAGEIVVHGGAPIEAFYIVIEGKLSAQNTAPVSTTADGSTADGRRKRRLSVSSMYLEAGAYFGEQSITSGLNFEQRVMAAELSTVITVPIEEFKEFIVPLLFKLDDFCLLKSAGTGGFSRVFTVQHRYSSAQYALKALTKTRGTRQDTFIKIVSSEKNILSQLDNNFLIKLYATFQDASHLYMLLELVRGGDFRDFLFEREYNRLSIPAAQFFGANVVLALEYLHERNITYRDLKVVFIIYCYTLYNFTSNLLKLLRFLFLNA